MGLKEYYSVKEEWGKAKEIKILPGTAFGFHSSFVGASTPFEDKVKSPVFLPVKGATRFDTVEIIPDILGMKAKWMEKFLQSNFPDTKTIIFLSVTLRVMPIFTVMWLAR